MPFDSKQKTILYFGLFDPEYSRNKVYIEGLRRNGIKVIICNDQSKGPIKFWRLFKKHWKVRRDYDLMIVGYGGQITVPLARLISIFISRKPVAFDALCSFYEVNVLSRAAFQGNLFRIPYIRLVDWVSTRFAHFIFVETDQQKEYFIKELGVRPDKLLTVYIGVDDTVFHPDDSVKKASRFTVLFRGRITAEAGATHVIAAAKILEKENIDVLVVGYGWDEAMRKFDAVLKELAPRNLRHMREHMTFEELRLIMLSSHVSLGQLEDHERLSRTIPHKAYESLAMKLSYVTARAAGVEEILTDGKDCLMVKPANPADLAAKIKMLRDDPALASRLAEAGFALYKERFTPEKVVAPIIELLHKIS